MGSPLKPTGPNMDNTQEELIPTLTNQEILAIKIIVLSPIIIAVIAIASTMVFLYR
jgi:hypothetical protein